MPGKCTGGKLAGRRSPSRGRGFARDRDVPGGEIRTKTINGVEFTVLSSKSARFNRISKDNLIHLHGHFYLYVGNVNWEQMYRAAGYDTSKLDFAYPADWADQPAIRARIRGGDKPAWYYGSRKGRIFGEPVWRSQVIRKIKARLGV